MKKKENKKDRDQKDEKQWVSQEQEKIRGKCSLLYQKNPFFILNYIIS